MANKKESKLNKAVGYAVVAGVLIGIGVGMIKGMTGPGTLIGLGVGFLVALILILLKKNN